MRNQKMPMPYRNINIILNKFDKLVPGDSNFNRLWKPQINNKAEVRQLTWKGPIYYKLTPILFLCYSFSSYRLMQIICQINCWFLQRQRPKVRWLIDKLCFPRWLQPDTEANNSGNKNPFLWHWAAQREGSTPFMSMFFSAWQLQWSANQSPS